MAWGWLKRGAGLIVVVVRLLVLGVLWLRTPPGATAELLPEILPPSSESAHIDSWTVENLVELRRVTGIAMSRSGEQVAFVLQQPSIALGQTRYGLYVVPRDGSSAARKLLEASYLADLSAYPAGTAWTARADLGKGVQVYKIQDAGKSTPLVFVPETVPIGGWEGVIAGLEAPKSAGVMSYEWAPDGTTLWYTRLRLRTESERSMVADEGLVYDDQVMSAATFRNHAGALVGTELRLFDPRTSTDVLLAYAPSMPTIDLGMFRRDWGTATWAQDSRHVLYCVPTIRTDAKRETLLWKIDTKTGHTRVLRKSMAVVSVVSNGEHSLGLEPRGEETHLVERAGEVLVKDHGPVEYERIGAGFGLGSWSDDAHGRTILGVRYRRHDGLATLPRSLAGAALESRNQNLASCSFSANRRYGACIQETVGSPPQAVVVDMRDGSIRMLANPNPEYSRIPSLRITESQWLNRYGRANEGYVVYPRNYQPGRKYPAIAITHAADARNRFADQEFEWEFPAVVFAEQGYFVLMVNEPKESLAVRASIQEHKGTAAANGSQGIALALDAVASMDAAAEAVVTEGLVDARKIAIAGYSRGAEVALYAMTQSKTFAAAAIGDGEANASSYWASGNRLSAAWYARLYGGSPYASDPEVIGNYRALSPTFRSHEFAGPLLQQFPAATANSGFELNRLLQEASTPTELVYFPNEGHLFWNPRHRAAAMRRNLQWFNFWLLGREDISDANRAQYERWRSMRLNRRIPERESSLAMPRHAASATLH
jgi:dipeptidyl aminopeptidase/acylaminoacyl peptidase